MQRPSESVGVFVLNFGSTVSDPCVIRDAYEFVRFLVPIHPLFVKNEISFDVVRMAFRKGNCEILAEVTLRGGLSNPGLARCAPLCCCLPRNQSTQTPTHRKFECYPNILDNQHYFGFLGLRLGQRMPFHHVSSIGISISISKRYYQIGGQ